MFAIVRCLQVVGGATSSFWATCIRFGFVFFVLKTFLDVYFVHFNLLYLVVEFLMFFFDSFRACFFCSENQLTTSICACSFSFFLAPLFVLLLSICLSTFIPYCTPLAIPKFLDTILSEHHNHRCRLPAFFSLCAYITKHPLLAHLGLCLPCFCFPPCPCIHPHPSETIYIHLHPYTPIFAKLPKT